MDGPKEKEKEKEDSVVSPTNSHQTGESLHNPSLPSFNPPIFLFPFRFLNMKVFSPNIPVLQIGEGEIWNYV